ncbi:hypothetical protein C8Q75DRAFT_773306 [Abortiporus biennis]|nr:hypothetical protein C8Q75DRAFT_773306 [Abortiporus biennis]
MAMFCFLDCTLVSYGYATRETSNSFNTWSPKHLGMIDTYPLKLVYSFQAVGFAQLQSSQKSDVVSDS